MVGAGLADVRPAEFLGVGAVLFVVSAALAYAFFGGAIAALVVGLFAAAWPLASYRRRSQTRQAVAMESWPRLI